MLSHVVKVHNALASCPRSIYADLRLHNATVCSTGHRLSVRILDAATLVRNLRMEALNAMSAHL